MPFPVQQCTFDLIFNMLEEVKAYKMSIIQTLYAERTLEPHVVTRYKYAFGIYSLCI